MIIQKIKIHYSVYFLLIISLFSGNILRISLLLFSIIFHELSHYFMLRKYNVKIKKLELSIIGGILEYEEINLKFKEVILIDIAGIVGNLLIILLIKLFNIESLQYLITYNIILIIFNLLPIIPLDGFRILKDSLSLIYDDEYTYLLIKNIDIFCLIMLFIILVIFKLYAQLIIWSFLLYKLIKYNIDNKKMLKLVELLKK